MVFKRTQKRGMSFLKHLFDCKEGKLTLNKLFFLSLLELSAAHAKKSREIFTTLGVSDAQPKILYILLAEDGWLQKDLAEFCKISPASMTILLNNMEKKNLVKRKKTQLSNGKRAFQIYLTENGRKIANYACIQRFFRNIIWRNGALNAVTLIFPVWNVRSFLPA